MKISPKDLVRLIVESNNQGYNQAVKHADRNYEEFSADFREAINRAQDETQEIKRAMPEALANAKSRAYEEGYKRGIEDQGKKTLELMTEARASERQKIEASEPKLSVWFKPCGPSPKPPEAYPPDLEKIDGIRAIREAYGSGEGYGLKEVKDLVEIEPGSCRFAAGDPLPQSKAVTLYLALQAAGFDPVLKG